jgi:predicted O-methyltransferase YrrM
MNKVLRKSAIKVLLTPYIRKEFERICRFYAALRFEEGLDLFKGESEFHGILRAGPLDIKEAFTERDAKAIEKLVQMVRREEMTVAEVGSWKGYSTSILAKAVADFHGKVFAVDHWMGSEGVKHKKMANTEDIFHIFKRNMIALGIWDMVNPLVMDSQTACKIFADGILDLVFIDADHRYEHFKKDISSWLPKLKDGGILCGHDCEGRYSEYSEEDKKRIEENLEIDYIFDMKCHPGVVKALHEFFQGKYSLMPNSTIWYHIEKGSSPNS